MKYKPFIGISIFSNSIIIFNDNWWLLIFMLFSCYSYIIINDHEESCRYSRDLYYLNLFANKSSYTIVFFISDPRFSKGKKFSCSTSFNGLTNLIKCTRREKSEKNRVFELLFHILPDNQPDCMRGIV